MPSVTDAIEDVIGWVVKGLCILLACTLAFGAVTLLLAHQCLVPLAPRCFLVPW